MPEEILNEQRFWQLNRESYLTQESWAEAIGRLVASLAEFLEESLELNEISVEYIRNGDTAVVAFIDIMKPFGGPLSLAWRGALGVELHEDRPYVSASIFLFCLGKRLSLAGHEKGSYIELVCEPTPAGLGQWKVLGWFEDIYGEYVGIDECSAYD